MPGYLKEYGKITKSDSTTAKGVMMIRKRRKEIGEKEVAGFGLVSKNGRVDEAKMSPTLLARYKRAFIDAGTDTTFNRALEDVKRSQAPGGPIVDDVNAARRAIIEESRKIQFKKKTKK